MRRKNDKIIITFIIVLLTFISCVEQDKESYKSPIRPNEELFEEAKEMKGLANFIIGETTIKDVLALNREIKKDERYGYFYLNSWIGDEFKEAKYQESCPYVKIISIPKYFVGEIEIQYVELHFYKNVLYKINSWTSDKLENAFTMKYSEGVKDYYRLVVKKKEETNVKAHTKIKWENENIVAKFNSSIDDFGGKLKHTNDFEIVTKSKKLLDEIRDCRNEVYNKQQQEKEKKEKESLDKI